ncbi:molybdopterin-binding protein [Streptomyces sp. NPDC001922]|uniref:molybdopterin molybdotransferase MoeA n=1 Tax=Streptomyces sp. NPDC001922 TaxID=3364624 RepID=UPI00367D5C34
MSGRQASPHRPDRGTGHRHQPSEGDELAVPAWLTPRHVPSGRHPRPDAEARYGASGRSDARPGPDTGPGPVPDPESEPRQDPERRTRTDHDARTGPDRDHPRTDHPRTGTDHAPRTPNPTAHPGVGSGAAAPASAGGRARHGATPWPAARERAARAASGPLPTEILGLGDSLGRILAEPLPALTDLPSFDTSAMDGWALAGPGPWTVDDPGEPGILAGQEGPAALPDGHAVRIATGAPVPAGTTAVLRTEHGGTRGRPGSPGERLHIAPGRNITPGQDIRPRGQECRRGDRLLPGGTLVTPAVLGLAAAAGYDELPTVARPRVEVLVLGDELLTSGLPREGRIRDALGPMLGPWLRALGADVVSTRRLGDDAGVLHRAVADSTADLLVTTGGTAAGPVDHLHPILRRAGATLLVDGVAVRPGHPMLLARLAPERHLVGLPGNPLAAVSGLLTLAEPLLRTLSGRGPNPYAVTLPFATDVQGHPHDTRLVPVALDGGAARPLHFTGPAMLRGIAAADGLAVVPPGGAAAGTDAEILELPWPDRFDAAAPPAGDGSR